jgi:hypothetical protein
MEALEQFVSNNRKQLIDIYFKEILTKQEKGFLFVSKKEESVDVFVLTEKEIRENKNINNYELLFERIGKVESGLDKSKDYIHFILIDNEKFKISTIKIEEYKTLSEEDAKKMNIVKDDISETAPVEEVSEQGVSEQGNEPETAIV